MRLMIWGQMLTDPVTGPMLRVRRGTVGRVRQCVRHALYGGVS